MKKKSKTKETKKEYTKVETKMQEEKARQILNNALDLVEKLNAERPAQSIGLTNLSYEDYITKSTQDTAVSNNVFHHVELLKFLSKAITQEIYEDKEEQDATAEFLVEAHSKIPPMGFHTERVELAHKTFKKLIACQGKKKAAELLEKFSNECLALDKPFKQVKSEFYKRKFPGQANVEIQHETHLLYHALSGMLNIAHKAAKQLREMKGK